MKNIGVKYGLICGLVIVIAQLAGFLLDLQSMGTGASIVSWLLVFAITFAIIYKGCAEHRDIHGNISTGQGFKIGVTAGLIAGLIAGLFGVLYSEVIDPEMTERIMEAAREDWEERNMTEEQMEQAEKWAGMFSNPALAIPASIIWYSIGGMIKGPISGAILHRAE